MKIITIVLSVAISSFINTIAYGQNDKAEIESVKPSNKLASFGVRGNCGMCKSTIENATKKLNGVKSADWDQSSKQIVVSYDSTLLSEDDIHQTIANSGYDTDRVIANEKAYNNLPGCCQYEGTQKMNQKIKKKENSPIEHDHNGHQH